MKKILFFEGRYNSIYGAQRSMLTLIENLPKSYKPILLTTKEGKLSKYAKEKNIEYKIIKAHPLINQFGGDIFNETFLNKLKIFMEIIIYNKKLLKYLKTENIDIIYNNGFRGLILSYFASKINKIPTIYYKRADAKANILIRKIVLTHSKIIFCIADGVKRGFTNKEIKKYNDKFKTLYTGYNFSKFSGKMNNNRVGKIKIGLVGSLTPRKGHKIAIKACVSLIKKGFNIKLDLYGSAPEGYEYYEKELKVLVDKLSMNNYVRFNGFIDNMKKCYNNIDILLLPSKSEGLPRVIIESFANGIPVVATDVGGVKEIIVNNNLGEIAEFDSKNFANKIENLIEENKYKKYKNERRKYVINKFNIKKYVNGFIENIQSIT